MNIAAFWRFLGCAAILLSNPILAQRHPSSASNEHLFPPEIITIVASRTATPLKSITSSVEILDEKHIEAVGSQTLADLLRTATSVGVSNSGGIGKNTTVRVRGEEGFRTRLYLDGISLLDPSAPQVAPIFDDVLTNHIRRIEILRGPHGLAYGADAGGIISMFSDAGEQQPGFGGTVTYEAGTYDSHRLSSSLNLTGEQAYAYIGATDLRWEGFNSQSADLSGESDGYENRTLHLNSGLNLSDDVAVKLVVRDVEARNEYDGCNDNQTFAITHQCQTNADNQHARLSLTAQYQRHQHEIGLAVTDINRSFFSNNSFSFASQGKISRADYVAGFAADSFELTLGADIEKQSLQSSSQARYQRGLFAEARLELSQQWYLNTGLRYDHNDTFGSHTSVRVGSAYIAPLSRQMSVKFKTSLASGFRAPSIFEQAYNDGPFAFGDAAGLQLTEENSEGVDIGIELYGSDMRVAVTGFYQTIEDEITFDSAFFQGYLQRPGSSRSQGIESSLSTSLTPHSELSITYTYNHTEDVTGNQRLRRPRHQANLSLLTLWLNDKLAVNGFVRYVGEAQDLQQQRLPAFTVANLTASYQLSAQLNLRARIENIADAEVTEVQGFNTAGRTFYAGIDYQF